MSDMESKLRETFIEEARERLSELEAALLGLEAAPQDREMIGDAFRSLHTIKGSGAMCGFDSLSSFAHELETVFDHLRNGTLCVTEELVSGTFRAVDMMRTMLCHEAGQPLGAFPLAGEIMCSFRDLLPCDPRRPAPEGPAPACAGDVKAAGIYHILFRPSREVFLRGVNPMHLLGELRGMGDCTIRACVDDIPSLDEIDPEMCYAGWDIFLYTDRDINAIKDVFIFVEGDCHLKVECCMGGEGEAVAPSAVVTPGMQEGKDGPRPVRAPHVDGASSIRVAARRLDRLMDLVGEIVTVQARLSQIASAGSNPLLTSVSEEVERLTDELRDITTTIRMVPIGSTFGEFKRVVRDVSLELHKEVELRTDGAETEIDKTVIEKLRDPLVHLIRNSLDHGIEPPGERLAAGKDARGTITLSAVHSGSHVLIEVKDDGRGLDLEAIKSRAHEKGLVEEGAELTEKELFGLVTSPGFSTARSLTNMSGRGVGLDVVRRNIESLRGSVDLDSKPGLGTSITLKLPLTLAIIEGLLVKIADGCFVVPLFSVEECIELERKTASDESRRRIMNIRGEVVPYVRLREHFGMPGAPPLREQVVITRAGGGKVGLAVDKVLGEYQTVIKPFGGFYRNVVDVSGATILGDGTVALILDVQKIVKSAAGENRAE